MVVEEFEPIIKQLQSTTKIFQAVGGLILAYIGFNIFNAIHNRKKRNELRRIRQSIEKIDKNIEKLVKKK
tara:strand:- start:447 stop:656 length:210 start_codon:yes stop_codon:yes gene_type:complete